MSSRHAGETNIFLFPIGGRNCRVWVAVIGYLAINSGVTSLPIKSYPQGVDKVAPKKENEMTNTIYLTNDHTDTWATGEGDVFTHKIGEFFKTVQNSSGYALSSGSFALTISERIYDVEANRLEKEVACSNVFVTREHARKFALEILAELERTENN